jgi:hypothetical protein
MGGIMNPAARHHKAFTYSVLSIALALFGLGCAGEPSAPDSSNHAPEVSGISVSGSRPVIAAGAVNLLLQATTADIDGDELSFTWSGDGSFHTQDDAAKTVRWNVPAGSYGDLTVSCTVSDGSLEDSRDRTFEVGRSLTASDYGDLVGNTITWSSVDAPFYILQGNVTIPEGVTLVVEEGLDIWCDSAKRLTVHGSLQVNGDQYGQVNFKAYLPDTEQKNYWEGIAFESGNGSIDLAWCNVLNANPGLSLFQGSGLGASLSSCGFIHCGTAVTANFAAIEISGCRAEDVTKGFSLSNTELSLFRCTFVGSVEEALRLNGGSGGSCEECTFTDVGAPGISISGASEVSFHLNSFLGTGQAFLVGGGYGESPAPLDARCNYWGSDDLTPTDIEARILYSSGSDVPELVYSPWRNSTGDACGDDSGPQLLGGISVVFDARHPLWGDPPAGVDLGVMAADGHPRLLEIAVDGQGTDFVHDYQWSATGDGLLFGTATAWPPQPPEDAIAYPAQADASDGSAIFFVVLPGSADETVNLTITDSWGVSTAAQVDFEY